MVCRLSKTDLKIRPIYLEFENEKKHIFTCHLWHTQFIELERVLMEEKYRLSVEQASELTHNMYQKEITLPESRHTKNIILKMDEDKAKLV